MGTHEHAVELAAVSSRWGDEDGFTIMESVVGLVLIVILFTTAATTLQLSIRSQRESRARQQAVAIAAQQIEDARSMTWEALALTELPPADDTNVAGSAVVASQFGLASNETLVVDALVGTVEPWIDDAETLDRLSFDVRQYVTDSGTGVRRVLVVVEWSVGGTAVDDGSGGMTHMSNVRRYVATTQMAEVTQ